MPKPRLYTEHERPVSFCACYDCELPYKQFPCDAVVANDIWRLITPTARGDLSGLLCPNCMCRRLSALGFSRVDIAPPVDEFKELSNAEVRP